MGTNEDASRRDFLQSVLLGGVALGVGETLPADALAQSAGKSTVVVATDSAIRGAGGVVDADRVGALLDRAMQTYFGTGDPWSRLVQPGQVVGLKVNTLGGLGMSTSPALVLAIARRLHRAGIETQNIIAWDRDTRELRRAGFPTSGSPEMRVLGSDTVGYEEMPEKFGVVASGLSKILTQMCDVVINLPILKDHSYSGVTLAMKNMYGVISNPHHYHSNGCNPGVADVNMLPSVRKKIRFTIADATTACYDGGPTFNPRTAWNADTLILGEDPVALDTVGWQIIERKRAEKGMPSLQAEGRPPRYIATAADAHHFLGTNDPARINRIQV